MPAHARSPLHFKIVHKQTGLCLDPAHTDGAEGRAVGLWACDDGRDQTFYYTSSTVLRTEASDRCLDVPSMAAGQLVSIWGCDGGDDQNWELTKPPGTGWGPLKVGWLLTLCLEAVPGSQARLATCDGTDKQEWAYVYLP